MYAIIRVAGKQYRVEENTTLFVSTVSGDAGETVTLDEVLAIGGDGEAKFGTPTLAGTTVTATIVNQGRGPKINGFTYKAKKGVRHAYGHRQDITKLKIDAISVGN
jgi:large subunit ribosomal protein L21